MGLKKRLLLVAAALLAVLLVAVGVFVATFDANRHRGLILDQLSQALNLPVDAQDVDLTLMPLRLRLNQVVVGQAEGFAGEEFFRARSVQADVETMSLLVGEPALLALEIQEPTVHITQHSNAEWNIARLARSDAAGRQPSGSSSRQAPLRNWSLSNGTVFIEPADGPAIRLDEVGVEVRAISRNSPFPFLLAFTFDSQGRLEAEGKLGPLQLESPLETPLNGRLSATQVPLSLLEPWLPLPQQLAMISASASLASESGATLVQIQADITDKAGDTLSLQGETLLAPDRKRLQINRMGLDYLGLGIQCQGSLGVGDSALTDLTMRIEDGDLQAARRWPARLGAALAELPQMKGKVSFELRLKGASARRSFSGQGEVRDVELSFSPQGNPVRAALLRAVVQPGGVELTVPELKGAGGTFQGSLHIAGFDSPQVDFDLSGDLLDVPAWQALLSGDESPSEAPVAAVPDWLKELKGQGKLRLKRLENGTMQLAPFSADLSMADGVMALRPFEFGIYQGKGRGSLTIDLRPSQPLIAFRGDLENADVNRLISDNSQSKDRIFGRLNASLRLNTAAFRRGGLLQNSRGDGSFDLKEGRLAGISLSRELSALSEFVGLKFDRQGTPIQKMSATLRIAEGRVSTDDLSIQTPDLTLDGKGGFAFEGALRLDGLVAFAPQSVTEQSRPRGLLGSLTGVLPRDRQGRPLLPFQLRGTFEEPAFRLDGARLTKMMGSGLLDSLFPPRSRPPRRRMTLHPQPVA